MRINSVFNEAVEATMTQNDYSVKTRLRGAGLRPTRQRVALAYLLFAKGDRHVTAEMLHEEAVKYGVPVSLATVYNTLHQFTAAGLLRELTIDGSKTYFDTDVSNHFHFYCETDNAVFDVPDGDLSISGLPTPPDGMEIDRVDVVIRLKEKEPRS